METPIWQFKDGPTWRTYSSEDCTRLDDAYLRGRAHCVLTSGIVVDINKWQQLGAVRPLEVRRLAPGSLLDRTRDRPESPAGLRRPDGYRDAGAAGAGESSKTYVPANHWAGAAAGLAGVAAAAAAPSKLGPAGSLFTPGSLTPASPAAADPRADRRLGDHFLSDKGGSRGTPQKWQYEDGGVWKDYSLEHSSQLENAYGADYKVLGLSVNGEKYFVDFERMDQRGPRGFRRKVNRVPISLDAGRHAGNAVAATHTRSKSATRGKLGVSAHSNLAAPDLGRAKSDTVSAAANTGGVFAGAAEHPGLDAAPHRGAEFVWQWQSSPTGGDPALETWENYSPEISSKLENAHRLNSFPCTFESMGGQYQVLHHDKMKRLVQMNVRDTWKVRPVQRVPRSRAEGRSASSVVSDADKVFLRQIVHPFFSSSLAPPTCSAGDQYPRVIRDISILVEDYQRALSIKRPLEAQGEPEQVMAALSLALFHSHPDTLDRPIRFSSGDEEALRKGWLEWTDLAKAYKEIFPKVRDKDGSYLWLRRDNSPSDILARLACSCATLRYAFGDPVKENDSPVFPESQLQSSLIFSGEARSTVGRVSITFSDKDVFDAAQSRDPDLKKNRIVVVSTANAYRVGGDFITGGIHALEEAMCTRSTLYLSLKNAERVAREYGISDERGKPIYVPRDGAVLSPDVRVFRSSTDTGYRWLGKGPKGNEFRLAAVVSIQMPNFNHEVADPPPATLLGADYEELVKKKMQTVIQAAAQVKASVLVMPDVGCGTFQNSPAVVGRILGQVLSNSSGGLFEVVLACRNREFFEAVQQAYGEASAEAPAEASVSRRRLPEAAAASAPSPADEFPGEMISTKSGRYSVLAGSGPQKLDGSYTFDATTQQVRDSKLGLVGTFSCNRLASTPLKGVVEGTVDGWERVPVISITDSEIMAEIQNGENEGAFFMLPSQFNGAEYPDFNEVITRLEDYRYDNTGGPRGQLAAHPAPAQFIIDNAACRGRPDGINAVKDVVRKLQEKGLNFNLVNGYLAVPAVTSGSEGQVYDILKANLHSLRMLVMSGVPASGLTPDKRGLSKATHMVNLIYASAVPVQAYMNMGGSDAKAVQTEVATLLATAQYYGAMKHAAQPGPGKKKVYLMPLGGGVFNNTWESIALAMSMAVELLTQEERDVLEIRALTWEGNPAEKGSLSRLLSHHQKLAGMRGI